MMPSKVLGNGILDQLHGTGKPRCPYDQQCKNLGWCLKALPEP